MQKLISNILATDMTDVKKSVRDALLFAAGLFALKFLGALDQHSIMANNLTTLTVAFWSGADAVYSSWLALLMPMLMRTVRTGSSEQSSKTVTAVMETGSGVVVAPEPTEDTEEM